MLNDSAKEHIYLLEHIIFKVANNQQIYLENCISIATIVTKLSYYHTFQNLHSTNVL